MCFITAYSDSGEDISNTETEDSSEFDYDDEYDDDFIDDDEMFCPSPVPNSGGIVFYLVIYKQLQILEIENKSLLVDILCSLCFETCSV